MNQTRLNNIVNSFPQTPGIYFFKDNKGSALYIGKASRLKNRLISYLKTKDTRIQKMIEEAKSLKFLTIDSDIEALILEAQYIKKLSPRFNIVMRDDKQYFHVGFTKEKFSHIFISHQPKENQNGKIKMENEYIGPFTDGTALKTTLRFLRNIFPYCTCKQKHNIPCLNYHIGKCLGFCCLKETQNAKLIANNQNFGIYAKNIKAIKNILSGKKTSLIKKLKLEMATYAKKEQFAKAIELRNKIEKLEKVFENAQIINNRQLAINNPNQINKNATILKTLAKILKLKVPLNRIEGYDISNIQGTHAVGSMVVFENGQPDKNEYRKFKIRSKNKPNDTAMLSEILKRRFRHPEWRFPDLILVDGGKGQLNAVLKTIDKANASVGSPTALRRGQQLSIPVMGIAKGKMEIFSSTLKSSFSINQLPDTIQNFIKQIDGEAHRFAINYYRKLHRNSSFNI